MWPGKYVASRTAKGQTQQPTQRPWCGEAKELLHMSHTRIHREREHRVLGTPRLQHVCHTACTLGSHPSHQASREMAQGVCCACDRQDCRVSVEKERQQRMQPTSDNSWRVSRGWRNNHARQLAHPGCGMPHCCNRLVIPTCMRESGSRYTCGRVTQHTARHDTVNTRKYT